MDLLHRLKISLVVIASLMMTACVMPKTSISDISEVKNDEVIVVGKLQLLPHIQKDEVQLTNFITLGKHEFEPYQSLRLIVSDVYYDLEGQAAHDFSDAVFTIDGEYFYFTWNRNKPMHILGTSFITRSTQTNIDTMTLSLNKGLKVSHSKKSKAIYVGAISFKRDEFFNIKDIKISQKGYKKARTAFRKKFKTKMNLEKAKLSSSRKRG